jgi:hypothetical protein
MINTTQSSQPLKLTQPKEFHLATNDRYYMHKKQLEDRLKVEREHEEKVTHLLTHSLTHLLTYSLTHLLTYLLTHSLTHSLTHLLTHLLAYLFRFCESLPR